MSAAIVAGVIVAGGAAYAAHEQASSANKARDAAAAPTSTTTTSNTVRGTPGVQAADAAALADATRLYGTGAGVTSRGVGGGVSKQSRQLAQQLFDNAQKPVANLAAGNQYVGSVLGQGPAPAQPTLADLPANLQAQVKSGKMKLADAVQQAIKNRPDFAAKFGAAVAGGGDAASQALAYNPVAQALYNSINSPGGSMAKANAGLQDFYDKGGGATPGGLASFAKTGIVPDATDPNSSLGKYESGVLSDSYLDPAKNPALAGVMKAISDAETANLNPQLAAFTGQANKMGMFGGSGFAVGEADLRAKAQQEADDEFAKTQLAAFESGRTIQEQIAAQENATDMGALSAAGNMRGQNLTAQEDISKNTQAGLGVEDSLAKGLSADRQAAIGDVGTLSAAGMAPAATAWQLTHGNDTLALDAGKANASIARQNALAPTTALNTYLEQLNLLGGQNVTTSGTGTQTHDPTGSYSDPTAAAITGGLGGALGAYGLFAGNNADTTGTNPSGALQPGVVGASQNPYGVAGNPVNQIPVYGPLPTGNP